MHTSAWHGEIWVDSDQIYAHATAHLSTCHNHALSQPCSKHMPLQTKINAPLSACVSRCIDVAFVRCLKCSHSVKISSTLLTKCYWCQYDRIWFVWKVWNPNLSCINISSLITLLHLNFSTKCFVLFSLYGEQTNGWK